MKRFILDIETNGLLKTVSKVHCMVLREVDTNRIITATSRVHIQKWLTHLEETDAVIIGHNIIGFDLPVLQKLFTFNPKQKNVIDTLIYGRVVYPHLKVLDDGLIKKGLLPPQLRGSHSLKAWGYRLGQHKGDYAEEMMKQGLDPWAELNEDMLDYCVQDTSVTLLLYNKLESKQLSAECLHGVELPVAHIIARQERYGLLFDEAKAMDLYGTLTARRAEVAEQLKRVFKPMYLKDGKPFTPARDNAKTGYVAGAPFQKLKLTEFNPGSRSHIAHWLIHRYQWEPTEFTDKGAPKIDEETFKDMQYPEVQLLVEYLLLVKRCGQLAEGNEAWLKKVEADGRIRGSVNTNGCITGRMSHSSPNMGQVPAARSLYGPECRALFRVRPGKKMVGCDADALELRVLAHFLAIFDGGEYTRVVLNGDKEQGTDMHTRNSLAIGLDPKKKNAAGESGRDVSKRFFYAFIYGGGDELLGNIISGKKGAAARSVGAKAKRDFLRSLPALNKLIETVKHNATKNGHLKGLDGRIVPIRSMSAALNLLVQGAGAVLMKKALVIMDEEVQARGYLPGIHYEFVLNVHDEVGLEVDEAIAEEIGRICRESIRRAGEYYKLRCPLDGEYKIGENWYETH